MFPLLLRRRLYNREVTMMDIQVVNNNPVAIVEDYKKIATDYLRGMGMNIPQKYAEQFIDVAQAYGLNPIKREIYAVGYGDNWNVITGYEVYLKRAERTGKLDGWECNVEGNSKDNWVAKLTIHRKDWKFPFEHTVQFSECCGKRKDGSLNSMWQKMPTFMLKKVCIAQGFRLCFPDELGGMPYTSDELPEIEKPAEKNITGNATATTSKIEPKQQKIVPQEQQKQVDYAVNLENLLNNYEQRLKGKPYDMAEEVLKTGSDGEIVAMYDRVVSYLNKQGIKV